MTLAGLGSDSSTSFGDPSDCWTSWSQRPKNLLFCLSSGVPCFFSTFSICAGLSNFFGAYFSAAGILRSNLSTSDSLLHRLLPLPPSMVFRPAMLCPASINSSVFSFNSSKNLLISFDFIAIRTRTASVISTLANCSLSISPLSGLISSGKPSNIAPTLVAHTRRASQNRQAS